MCGVSEGALHAYDLWVVWLPRRRSGLDLARRIARPSLFRLGSSSPPVLWLVFDRGRRLYSIVWLQSLILSPFHGASLSHSEPFRLSMSWSSVRRRPASAAWATMTASKKSMPGAFVYNVLNLWSSDGVYRWNRTFSSSCRTLRLSPKPVWAAA